MVIAIALVSSAAEWTRRTTGKGPHFRYHVYVYMYVYVCIYWIIYWLLWFPWQLKERAEQLVKDRITFIIYMYMCIYVCIYIHIYVYLYMYILNYLLIALASLAVERTRRTTGKGPHHRRPAPSVAGQVWLTGEAGPERGKTAREVWRAGLIHSWQRGADANARSERMRERAWLTMEG